MVKVSKTVTTTESEVSPELEALEKEIKDVLHKFLSGGGWRLMTYQDDICIRLRRISEAQEKGVEVFANIDIDLSEMEQARYREEFEKDHL